MLVRAPGFGLHGGGGVRSINTTAVYTDFLFRNKKWLQDGADEVIWLKIHNRWTVGQFYY
jgi:hypothetical protein